MANFNRLSIFVTSCDLYKDCWEPLLYSFKKYWPTCPYPIYIVSNFEGESDEQVTYIKVGEHLGWGSNSKKALKEVDSKYILHFHEDYFLNRPFNTDIMERHLDYCDNNSVQYLRLSDHPIRDKFRIGNSCYCQDPLGEKYSLCMQPSIWRKDLYESLCVPGWSCWDFENSVNNYLQKEGISVNAQMIHSSFFRELCIPIIPETAIRKGKWTMGGVKFLKDNGFDNQIQGRLHEGYILTGLIKLNEKGVRMGPILPFLQNLKINI